MHMQDGIGRGGYRVLALVALGVGALGMLMAAVSLGPSGFSEWLGLGLAALAIAGLAGLVLAALGLPPASPRPSAAPVPAGAPDADAVELPTPEPPANPDPAADVGFEYQDLGALEPVSVVPPPTPVSAGPPPRPFTPPPPSRAPPAGRAGRKASAKAQEWPERAPPAGVTRRQLHERNLPRDPGPDIEVEGPAVAARKPPVVMARTVASAEASGIPEGASVGKCGNCGVLLVAPKKRPLRLQCPRCERVHTLA